MRALNGGGGETHFTVSIVSPEFEGKVSCGHNVLEAEILKLIMCASASNTTASSGERSTTRRIQ